MKSHKAEFQHRDYRSAHVQAVQAAVATQLRLRVTPRLVHDKSAQILLCGLIWLRSAGMHASRKRGLRGLRGVQVDVVQTRFTTV